MELISVYIKTIGTGHEEFKPGTEKPIELNCQTILFYICGNAVTKWGEFYFTQQDITQNSSSISKTMQGLEIYKQWDITYYR